MCMVSTIPYHLYYHKMYVTILSGLVTALLQCFTMSIKCGHGSIQAQTHWSTNMSIYYHLILHFLDGIKYCQYNCQ